MVFMSTVQACGRTAVPVLAQMSVPLQGLPSSQAVQRSPLGHRHLLVLTVQVPLLQRSTVQGVRSVSQGVSSATALALQVPSAGSQVCGAQPSPSDVQVTVVAGFTAHLPLDLSQ